MTMIDVLVRETTVRSSSGTEETRYCAIGMQYFLVGEGLTAQEALSELDLAVQSTILANQHLNAEPFAGFKPAPEEFRALWEHGVSMAGMGRQDVVAGQSYSLASKIPA